MNYLNGAKAKIARARKFLDEKNRIMDEFFQKEPWAYREEPAEGDKVNVYFVEREAVPVELAMAFGDCLHNARSALDHLAWALAEELDGERSFKTCFPTSEDADSFPKKFKSKLRGLSHEVEGALASYEPWPNGRNKIWEIHQLDVADKHKVLLVTGAAIFNTGFEFRIPDLPFSFGWGSRAATLKPLRDGDLAFSYERGGLATHVESCLCIGSEGPDEVPVYLQDKELRESIDKFESLISEIEAKFFGR